MLDRCGKNIYYVEKSFVRYFMRHKSSIKMAIRAAVTEAGYQVVSIS